jgi:signal transduction histidine kinase
MMARTKTTATLTIVGDCDLPTDVKIAFYRIAQEALNNMVKHSRASQARINLENDGTQITLRVADDGCGFDARDKGRHGLGIGIINDRGQEIGAELLISSQIDSGTEIYLAWREPNQQ